MALAWAMAAPSAPGTWAQVPYAEASYWEARYGKEHQPFEWFLGYTALRRVLRAFLSKRKPVLQIGCGTSNIQEGMAKAGWTMVNVDIARNVIDKLKQEHSGIPGLSYAVTDCRNMPEYMDCEFGGVLDKGTVDALLCCKDGVSNVTRMFAETSRVLAPGGTFLLISLGDPTRRLCLLCCERFDWAVQVVLLPKISQDNQATVDGRAINDTLRPVDFLGPFEVLDSETLVGVPRDIDYSRFFFGYVCKKRRLTLPLHPEQRQRLPHGWVLGSRAVVAKLQQELGLPADLLSRGRRTRSIVRPRSAANGLPAAGVPAATPAPGAPGVPLASLASSIDAVEADEESVGTAPASPTLSTPPPPRTHSVPNFASDAAAAAAARAVEPADGLAAGATESLQRLQELQQQAETQAEPQMAELARKASAGSPRAGHLEPHPLPSPADPAASSPPCQRGELGCGDWASGHEVAEALASREQGPSDEASDSASYSVQCTLDSASECMFIEDEEAALRPAQPDRAQRIRRHSAPPGEAALMQLHCAMMQGMGLEPCVPPEPPKKGMQRLAECDISGRSSPPPLPAAAD